MEANEPTFSRAERTSSIASARISPKRRFSQQVLGAMEERDFAPEGLHFFKKFGRRSIVRRAFLVFINLNWLSLSGEGGERKSFQNHFSLIQRVIRAGWPKLVMQRNKLEIWGFVLPNRSEKINKASWLWWFGGYIWKLKVICSILEVIWTNGGYGAALAAKKQTEKPGMSPISPNYTGNI